MTPETWFLKDLTTLVGVLKGFRQPFSSNEAVLVQLRLLRTALGIVQGSLSVLLPILERAAHGKGTSATGE